MRRPKACPFRRSDGSYWARVRYIDESGKTRNKTEKAESMADATAKSIELLKKYDVIALQALPNPITFNEFADSFIHHIEGQRSYKTALGFLNTLRGHFGNKQINSITYAAIQEYYKKRCKSVSRRTGKRLKKASVNREVALLSSMFKEAIEQGLAAKNPVKDGTPLIKPEQETRRNRILSEEEEERLLAVCTGRRAHLRPVIIAALDTVMTKGQLMRLTWRDVKIGLRQIYARSSKGKVVRLTMTQRLADALAKLQEALQQKYSSDPRLYSGAGALLFSDWIEGMKIFCDVKSSFSSACRTAKIKDLRFNDLRRTAILRLSAKRERLMSL